MSKTLKELLLESRLLIGKVMSARYRTIGTIKELKPKKG